MPDENNSSQQPAKAAGSTKQEVALELMRFIAGTTGYGKASSGAGFGGKSPKTPDEQVDALLELYKRCFTAVSTSE
jgi:hypothetical protein